MEYINKDIIVEICSNLLERDLISLYQVNKSIRGIIINNDIIMNKIQSYIAVQKEPFLRELYKFVAMNNIEKDIVTFYNEVKERPYGIYFIIFLNIINEDKYSFGTYMNINGKENPNYFYDFIEPKYKKSFYRKMTVEEEFDNFSIVKINLNQNEKKEYLLSYYHYKYIVPMNAHDFIYIVGFSENRECNMYIPIYYGKHEYIMNALLDMILFFCKKYLIIKENIYSIDLVEITKIMKSSTEHHFEPIYKNPLCQIILPLENIITADLSIIRNLCNNMCN